MLDRDQTRSLVSALSFLLGDCDWLGCCDVSSSESLNTEESKSNTDASASSIAPLSLSSLLHESGSSSLCEFWFCVGITTFSCCLSVIILSPVLLAGTGGADFMVKGPGLVAGGFVTLISSWGYLHDLGTVDTIRIPAGEGGSTYWIGLGRRSAGQPCRDNGLCDMGLATRSKCPVTGVAGKCAGLPVRNTNFEGVFLFSLPEVGKVVGEYSNVRQLLLHSFVRELDSKWPRVVAQTVFEPDCLRPGDMGELRGSVITRLGLGGGLWSHMARLYAPVGVLLPKADGVSGGVLGQVADCSNLSL